MVCIAHLWILYGNYEESTIKFYENPKVTNTARSSVPVFAGLSLPLKGM